MKIIGLICLHRKPLEQIDFTTVFIFLIRVCMKVYSVLFLVVFLFACADNAVVDDRRSAEVLQENAGLALNPKLTWHWEDDFTSGEHRMHQIWVNEVYNASQSTLGEYPFNLAVHFHKSKSNDKPVSFGYSSRKKNSQIHLFVSTAFKLDELVADWTAQHEISHMAVPFMGKNDLWFSEGFASFFGRQIMMEMGMYSQQEFDDLHKRKICKATSYFTSEKTFVEVADSLKENHNYSDLYWGGTSFFLTIDLILREKNKRFIEIVQAYQTQNRKKDNSMQDLVKSFDALIGGTDCQDLLIKYQTEPAINVVRQFEESNS